MERRRVFITGGTGYLGRALVAELVRRGHEVRALVRRGSEGKLPAGCEAVAGDPLDEASFADAVKPSETFVQLVGVPRPSPAKARQFREIDLVSGRASVGAARGAGIEHFVYVSVAQPAPVMKAYQEVRAEDAGQTAQRLKLLALFVVRLVAGDPEQVELCTQPLRRAPCAAIRRCASG